MGSDKNLKAVKKAVDCISTYGPERVLDVLTASFESKDISHTILLIVCNEFSISLSELKKGNSRGKRMDATIVCYELLKKHTNLRRSDISFCLGSKDLSSLSKLQKRFALLDEKIPDERKLLEKYRCIDNQITEILKQQ